MKKSENKNLLLWPDLAIIEFLTAITLTIILVIWALLINVPLLEIVSPGISDNPSNAPWYSVGLQELLVYFDPWIAGVIIPGLIIACLMFIPYLSTRSGGSGEASVTLKKFALINFNLGFLMWLLLIFTGYFLRGAERPFYLPWESWKTVKQVEGNLWSPDPLRIAGPGCLCRSRHDNTAAYMPRFLQEVRVQEICNRNDYNAADVCGSDKDIPEISL